MPQQRLVDKKDKTEMTEMEKMLLSYAHDGKGIKA